MTFNEAMEKFVIDGDEAEDYDKEKKFDFAKSKKSLFSNSAKHPLLFTKLPDMSLVTADGKTIQLSSLVNDHKPTVLVFYMSKAGNQNTLSHDVDKLKNVVNMFGGSADVTKQVLPKEVLESIHEIYLTK